MDYTGSGVTCIPVQFDDSGDWESAVFFQVGGSESKHDRRIISRAEHSIPVAIDTDVIKHESASVIVIRLEIFATESDPLIGEILLTPGEKETHFETVRLLTVQPILRWFFSDSAYWIIHSQQNQLGSSEHDAFKEILDEATQHDAMIRLTGRYDVESALREVVSHYEFRSVGYNPQAGTASNVQ